MLKKHGELPQSIEAYNLADRILADYVDFLILASAETALHPRSAT